ncbi:hypothetical protein FNV43_RR15086 [Rhamnella rubrinervis]|uniref:GTP-binding nuclear protein n=1 Tax=Rhamnella rubrinervis TaxID=2594499 RepID=A0A8K0GWH8_9ROSA|nr:hypothetical protein FNV43_RR15086 [Rhamnella rubrinervis]
MAVSVSFRDRIFSRMVKLDLEEGKDYGEIQFIESCSWDVILWFSEYARSMHSQTPLDQSASFTLHQSKVIRKGSCFKLGMNHGGWNEELLRELFDFYSAQEILKLDWPCTSRQDKLLWMGNCSGIFGVKSAFLVNKGFNGHYEEDILWRNLWKMNLHQRLKNAVEEYEKLFELEQISTDIVEGPFLPVMTNYPADALVINTNVAIGTDQIALSMVVRDARRKLVFLASSLSATIPPYLAEMKAMEWAIGHQWSLFWISRRQKMLVDLVAKFTLSNSFAFDHFDVNRESIPFAFQQQILMDVMDVRPHPCHYPCRTAITHFGHLTQRLLALDLPFLRSISLSSATHLPFPFLLASPFVADLPLLRHHFFLFSAAVLRFWPGYVPSRISATISVEVHPLDFFTNCGRSGSTAGARLCAIIMFDVTACLTYKNVPTWHRDLCRVCENMPIVLCGNKVDVKNRQVNAKQVTFQRKKNLQYYEISAKSNYNFEKPFLYLAKKLAG